MTANVDPTTDVDIDAVPDHWSVNHIDYVPTRFEDDTRPIPLYGARVVCCVGPEGEPMYSWHFDNCQDVNGFEVESLLRHIGETFKRDWIESHKEYRTYERPEL